MYKSLHIRSFRCFKDLRLNELSPVNLIVGQNNVGKTALLEAIFVHSGVTNPELALRLGSYRGMMSGYKFPPGPPFPWDTLFRNLDPSVPIEIASIDENGHSRRSQLTVLRGPLRRVRAAKDDEMVSARSATTEERTYGLMLESHQQNHFSEHKLVLERDGIQVDEHPAPPFPTVFMFSHGRSGEDTVQRFSDLLVNRATEPILRTLKILEPRLQSLSILTTMGATGIWADVGLPQMLPVQVLGDGVGRLLTLVTAMTAYRGGVVLSDEIDAGIHHSSLREVWRAVFGFVNELGIQMFATTHSHECLAAAHDAAREFMHPRPLLLVHRLDRIGDRLDVVTYDDDTLDSAIAADLEVR